MWTLVHLDPNQIRSANKYYVLAQITIVHTLFECGQDVSARVVGAANAPSPVTILDKINEQDFSPTQYNTENMSLYADRHSSSCSLSKISATSRCENISKKINHVNNSYSHISIR